jgi:hypothetical protein
MDYLDPSEARDMSGLRLVLTQGAPAPYSMSARAIFDQKSVAYAPVAQVGAGSNDTLVEWTRHRNAPLAIYNDEAPRAGWLDILNLAERLGDGASLVPADIETRMQMIGLVNELIGENGLIWNMRLVMLGLAGPERAAAEAQRNPMYAQYGYSEGAHKQALQISGVILERFTSHVKAQRVRGSDYLIGAALSAADIYWAYFSLIFKTLPDEVCPMPRSLRKSYDLGGAAIGGCDEVLIAQRDRIFDAHLSLPMTF